MKDTPAHRAGCSAELLRRQFLQGGGGSRDHIFHVLDEHTLSAVLREHHNKWGQTQYIVMI